MKIQEIIKEFGITEKTVYNWKNSGTGRKLLYDVLSALPIEFVENIKKIEDDKKKNEEMLK